MNRILKVVGGPLKGAEIALVAGTRVKVGSGDECDVLVSDSTLGEVAFELEVAEDEVSIITPDGATKTLLDYEAHVFGASAFAIGAAEGNWPEIVWPEKSVEGRVKSEEVPSGEVPPKMDPPKAKPKDARPEVEEAKAETGGGKHRVFWLVALVLLAVVIVLALFAFHWLRCRSGGVFQRNEVTIVRQMTLADVASRYGIAVVETNGQVIVRGNLKTRAERLETTAAAFQAQPGIELDLTDDESLGEAAEALVSMLADETLKVEAATNRIVVLRGDAGTSDRLREVLVAMARDIPGLDSVDCANVVCGLEGDVPAPSVLELPEERIQAAPEVASTAVVQRVTGSVAVARKPHSSSPAPRKASRAIAPPIRLPLCGIMTVPYPCIILKNGNRVFEGGELGDYTVEKIAADAVMLRNDEKTFKWKP